MSDVLWWVLQPSGLLLTAVVLSWLLLLVRARAAAQSLLTLALLTWAAAVLLPIDAWAARPLEDRHAAPEALPDDIDGIVVLGGAVDWRVTVARGQLNLGASAERVLAGAALARRYPDAVLAFTGVGPEVFANDFTADPGPRSLVFGAAFEDRRPVFLSAASSTYEDALLALERLSPRPGERWLLVTSAWHMPRAWATFRTLGWTTLPYPVDYLSGGDVTLRLGLEPAAARLASLDRVAREWGAIWIYRRTERITEEAWRASSGAL